MWGSESEKFFPVGRSILTVFAADWLGVNDHFLPNSRLAFRLMERLIQSVDAVAKVVDLS
ncbi:hypothetical protein GCM10017579_31790 [Nocardioides luteus]|uniref:Uncharacterized protein n=1 Tax=Nocardioides luteus TaxID=1844 RepID=A0ABQ5T005_9ACTN|nr:hypothetical protein GCM10017579_31790 [Nocardioides luteus]